MLGIAEGQEHDSQRPAERDPAGRSTCSGTAASARTCGRRPRPTPRSADKANDAIRVTGAQLRWRSWGGRKPRLHPARTYRGRNGVLISTDAIDNSAGVDTSDHEVNIKILLDRIVRGSDLTPGNSEMSCWPR